MSAYRIVDTPGQLDALNSAAGIPRRMLEAIAELQGSGNPLTRDELLAFADRCPGYAGVVRAYLAGVPRG